MTENIRAKITARFHPVEFTLEDQSARHEGHAGARPGGESHFKIILLSEEFTGVSRLERQRMVYATLKDELDGGLHALAMDLKAPSE